MSGLTQWLTSQNDSSAPDLDAASVRASTAVFALIEDVLKNTETAVAMFQSSAQTSVQLTTIPDDTRARLQTAITNWAQHSHADLQQSLARAVMARSWRRTSWIRLLWRVDDVGVGAEEVLRSHWLLDAESGLAFLAGRVEEAGFFQSTQANSQATYNPNYALNPESRPRDGMGNPTSMERSYATPSISMISGSDKSTRQALWTDDVKNASTSQLLRSTRLLDRVQKEGGIDILHSRPWPMSISFTRQKLLHTLVPTLLSRAQTLLLQTLSTIGATSALGAWFYVATAGVGIYEAGAVAALGTVFSLRRLQKKWEAERSTFENEVHETGRVVLAEVEEVMRGVVRDNERPTVRTQDVEEWQKARQSVERCEQALGILRRRPGH